MQVVEEVVMAVILISIFVVGGLVVTTQYTKHIVKRVNMERQAIEDRAASEDLNAVLLVTENVSKRTMGELLGTLASEQMQNPDKALLEFGDTKIDMKKELKKLFDATYGKDNYYFEMRPEVNDIALYFLFDGSESMDVARKDLAQNLPSIIKAFNDSGKGIDSRVYVLSDKGDKCDEFRGEDFDKYGITCATIDNEEIYKYSSAPFVSSSEEEITVFEDNFDSFDTEKWDFKGDPSVHDGYLNLTPSAKIRTKKSFKLAELENMVINFSIFQYAYYSSGNFHGFYIKLANEQDPSKFMTIDMNCSYNPIESWIVRFYTYDNLTKDELWRVPQYKKSNEFSMQHNWLNSLYNKWKYYQSNPSSYSYRDDAQLNFRLEEGRLIVSFSFYYPSPYEHILYNLTINNLTIPVNLEFGFNDTSISNESFTFYEQPFARIFSIKIIRNNTQLADQKITKRELSDFYLSDWGAASDYIIRQNSASTEALKLLFIGSDELSTSSLPDSYFTTDFSRYGNYESAYKHYYELCVDECPVDRAWRTVNAAMEAAKLNRFIVYPIFADPNIPDGCVYDYSTAKRVALNSYFTSQGKGLTLSDSETYCNQMKDGIPLCPACIDNPTDKGNKICSHYTCIPYIKEQMESLALQTGGKFLTLTDVSKISELVNLTLNKVVNTGFSIGEIKDGERYVFERDVPLSDINQREIFQKTKLIVYKEKESPRLGAFNHSEPRIFFKIMPEKGNIGESFDISWSIEADDMLNITYFRIADKKNNILYEHNYSVESDKFQGSYYLDSSSFYEGEYSAYIEARDNSGYSSSAEKRFYVMGDEPLKINKVEVTPSSAYKGKEFHVTADVSSSFGVKEIIITIKKPDGTEINSALRQAMPDIFEDFISSSGSDTGTYTISLFVKDNIGNEKKAENAASFDVEDISYKLKFLVLPVRYTFSQQVYEDRIQRILDHFIDATELNNCREKILIEDMGYENNYASLPQNAPCTDAITNISVYISKKGYNIENYDYIIALTYIDFKTEGLCTIGGSPATGATQGKFIFSSDTPRHVVAHELGHKFGLWDEYCSMGGGSKDFKCNNQAVPNKLDVAFECNASYIPERAEFRFNFSRDNTGKYSNYTEDCCFMNCSAKYPNVCCIGNSDIQGRISIMAAADIEDYVYGASQDRVFLPDVAEYFKNIPKLRCD
jgi:hypothetical protein